MQRFQGDRRQNSARISSRPSPKSASFRRLSSSAPAAPPGAEAHATNREAEQSFVSSSL